MLIEGYLSQEMLQNTGVNGVASEPNSWAYRGDMVLEAGEIADAQGRRMPPKSVVKQAVLLTQNDKFVFIAGSIKDLAQLTILVENYGAEYAPNLRAIIYAENIGKPLEVEYAGVVYTVLPIEDTAVWSALLDDIRLEKDDFKGQSGEEKVVTLYRHALDFNAKGAKVSFEEALALRVEPKKSHRGPV